MDNKTREIIKKLAPIRHKLLAEFYSNEEYREFILAMGITNKEWEQLQSDFDDFIARADNYIQHSLAQEAIEEIEVAQIIAPNNLEVHRCFSQAYLQRWKSTNDKKYAELSKVHAQNCLQINPEFTLAVKILAQLKKATLPQSPPIAINAVNAPLFQQKSASKKQTSASQKHTNGHQKPQKKTRTTYAIIGSIVVILMLFYLLFLSSDFRVYEKKQENKNTIKEIIELPSEEENLLGLPYEFEKTKHSNVEFEVVESSFKGKSDRYSYYSSLFTMKGFVSIREAEVEKMELLYDLYQGNKIMHTAKGYINIPKGIQPGDKVPFLFINGEKEKEWKLTKVKLRIAKIKEKAAKVTYPVSPKVNMIWRVQQNEKIDFDLKERHSAIKYNVYSKDILHAFTFLIENKGTASIKVIKCKFNWYDSKDVLISEDIFNIWGESNPILESGKIVLCPSRVAALDVGNKKIKITHYTVEILEVKY